MRPDFSSPASPYWESININNSNKGLIGEIGQETPKLQLSEVDLHDFSCNGKPMFNLLYLNQIEKILQSVFFTRFVHYSRI